MSRARSGQGDLFPPIASGARKPVAKPDLQTAIDAFHEAYRAAYGKPPTWGVKRAAMLKRLIAAHGVGEVAERIARLFAGGGPRWLTPPHDVETFVQHFDKLVIDTADQRRGVRPSDVLGKP